MKMDNAEKRRAQLRDLFTKMITAFGAKEFSVFASYLREDTVFEWPYLPLKEFPEQMVGRDAFVRTAEEGMADCLPYGHTVDQFYDQVDTDTLIVEYHTDTTHLPSNERYANRYISIVKYDGDKVAYWKEYINPLPVLEVYGKEFVNQSAADSNEDSL